ncbi:MAG: hypothetical protein ACP5I4_13405 [Oceanipulchritudo sp.]
MKDRLQHIESVLGQAADLQLRNEVALANMMRDGDEFRDRLDRYSANSDALGKKLELYSANSDALGKKLEQVADKLEHYANKTDALGERLDYYANRADAHGEKLEYYANKLEEHIQESREDRKRMNKAWGDLANKLGSVAEDVVAPNIPRMAVEDFGMDRVEDQVVNPYRVSRRGPQRYAEYDIVCTGPGKVIVVEVKSTPTVDKILQMPGRLAEFFDFYPEYEGREVIGVFASWSIPENLLPVITKAGLYGIAMGDETMDIVARPGRLH